MADTVQSLNRNRAIFIFAIGLIALVGLFLGGLYFSGQRADQLARLATSHEVPGEAKDKKPAATNKPAEKPRTDDSKKNDSNSKDDKKNQNNTGSSSSNNKKDDTPKKPTPAPAKKPTPITPKKETPAVTNPRKEEPLPATGSSTMLLSVPVLLVFSYAAYEYRRSRQAIQRAAFHENSVF